MQSIRRKIKFVIFLLAAAITICAFIYTRGGFGFGSAPEKKEILIDGGASIMVIILLAESNFNNIVPLVIQWKKRP